MERMSFKELFNNMTFDNGVKHIKILKNEYGITFDKIALVMGISPSTLRGAVKLNGFRTYVGEKKVNQGIENLKRFYLGSWGD